MTNYTVLKDGSGNILNIIRDDGVCIPVSPTNREYRRYLTDVATHGAYPEETISAPEPSTDPSLQDQIDTILILLGA